jgi:hypothetical protein
MDSGGGGCMEVCEERGLINWVLGGISCGKLI